MLDPSAGGRVLLLELKQSGMAGLQSAESCRWTGDGGVDVVPE